MAMFNTELCNGEGHYCFNMTGYLIPNCTFFLQIETTGEKIHFYLDQPSEIHWGDNEWELYPAGIVIGEQLMPYNGAPVEVRSNYEITKLFFGNRASYEYEILDINILRASYLTNCDHMCYNLKSLVGFSYSGSNKVTTFKSAWEGCSALLDFEDVDVSSATTLEAAWKGCLSMTDFTSLYSDTVETVYEAWLGCASMVNYHPIILESCTNWERAFKDNLNLQVMAFLDTAAGTDFDEMFMNDMELLCINAVNTTKIENAGHTWNMFLRTAKLMHPNEFQRNLILEGYEYINPNRCSDLSYCSTFSVRREDGTGWDPLFTKDSLYYMVSISYGSCVPDTVPPEDPEFGLQCTIGVDCPDCIRYMTYTGSGNDFEVFTPKELSQTLDYYYYADPNHHDEAGINDRIVVMDPVTMTMKAEVPTIYQNPGSVDRAGYTNKMYIRTTSDKFVDVMSTDTMSVVASIPLIYHTPRTTGSFNKYKGMQLVSGKDNPMISLIDVHTDTRIETVGDVASGGISGNLGGNATGHPSWVDSEHFTLLDRYSDSIKTYKVSGPTGHVTVSHVDTLVLPTGCHIMDVEAEVRFDDLTKTTFYAAIEGSPDYDAVDYPYGLGVKPQLWQLNWDGSSLTKTGETIFTDSNNDDGFHHYGITPNGIEVWCPMFRSGNLYVVDIATMAVTHTILCGLGAGHVNFSEELNLGVVTNHFSQFVTIVNMSNYSTVKVYVCDDAEVYGQFNQSHTNHISDDGLYFYQFATESGDFIRIDLQTYVVTKFHTGGTPEQSQS